MSNSLLLSEDRRAAPPLTWVPSSYLAEGIPYAMVMGASATMLKDLGRSDGEITLATASIGIAWSLKPLWAAFLDRYWTKKRFVVATEVAMAALLAMCALALEIGSTTSALVAILWALAFAGATQDICVDGVYVTSLDEKRQAMWIGVQGVAWNVGKIFATAVVVWLAGALEARGYSPRAAWTNALFAAASAMLALAAWHALVLPTGTRERARAVIASEPAAETSMARRLGVAALAGLALGATIVSTSGAAIGVVIGVATSFAIAIGWREHVPPFVDFFRKKSIWGMLAFVVLYRTGEGFLLQEAPLFIQARLEDGGLGLSLAQKAWIDGTISTSVSLVAGLLGGAFVSKVGLRRSLVGLAIAMNVPHVCYVYLSRAGSPAHPLSIGTIQWLVTIEKLGYSFGCVGLMLYMMQELAPGKYKMTHYAFATALMNLVLVPTQALSGPLADWLGYKAFFVLVMVVSIPSILVAWLAPFPSANEPPPA